MQCYVVSVLDGLQGGDVTDDDCGMSEYEWEEFKLLRERVEMQGAIIDSILLSLQDLSDLVNFGNEGS